MKGSILHEDFFLLDPLSTVISCPDMKPAPTRYLTASAISVGRPARFVRWSSISALSFCSAHRSPFSSPLRHSCATLTRPGATRLTRIPYLDTRIIIISQRLFQTFECIRGSARIGLFTRLRTRPRLLSSQSKRVKHFLPRLLPVESGKLYNTRKFLSLTAYGYAIY